MPLTRKHKRPATHTEREEGSLLRLPSRLKPPPARFWQKAEPFDRRGSFSSALPANSPRHWHHPAGSALAFSSRIYRRNRVPPDFLSREKCPVHAVDHEFGSGQKN